MSRVVSVLVPAFNEASFVARALGSLIRQDHEELEIIVIDDASTDETIEQVHSVDDPRIRLLRNECNSGLIESLNRGLSEARGEYVARMDADDASLPGRLSSQLEVMAEDPACVVVGTGLYVMNYEAGEFMRVTPVVHDEVIRKELRTHSPLNAGSAMYRTDALRKVGGFSAVGGRAEGFSVLKLLAGVGTMRNVPDPLYLYILRPGTGNRSRQGRFIPRNAAFAELTARSDGRWPDRVLGKAAALGWRFFHLLPRRLQVSVRRGVSKKQYAPLSEEERRALELWYESLDAP